MHVIGYDLSFRNNAVLTDIKIDRIKHATQHFLASAFFTRTKFIVHHLLLRLDKICKVPNILLYVSILWKSTLFL